MNRNLFSRHVSSVTALVYFCRSWFLLTYLLLFAFYVYLYFGCHLIDEINTLLLNDSSKIRNVDLSVSRSVYGGTRYM